MPWYKTGAAHYHEFIGIPEKVVQSKSSDLEPLDLQNGLALDCYKPSSEV